MAIDKMERMSRLLSTTSGTDKCLMLIQYSALLLSKIDHPTSKLAISSKGLPQRFGALSGLISEARTTIRLLDLVAVVQWWRTLKESRGSVVSRILEIERLEVLSMLVYYPLEHIYFLTAKHVLSFSARTASKASLYSCRAWATYTFLHLSYLWHCIQQLNREEDQYLEQDVEKKDRKKFQEQRAALMNGVMINLAYAPLTLHWSLSQGLYSSESITALCGIVAALGQLRAAWKASG
ncbi:peroxisomal biogenesis factor 11 [Melampsora americana]|nr:peroxisomal biogenesis factor 11 [Melampsora americana]